MPVGPEALGGEALDGAFGEQRILKTSSRQHDALTSGETGHCDNRFSESRVEILRDARDRNSARDVRDNCVDDRSPVDRES